MIGIDRSYAPCTRNRAPRLAKFEHEQSGRLAVPLPRLVSLIPPIEWTNKRWPGFRAVAMRVASELIEGGAPTAVIGHSQRNMVKRLAKLLISVTRGVCRQALASPLTDSKRRGPLLEAGLLFPGICFVLLATLLRGLPQPFAHLYFVRF